MRPLPSRTASPTRQSQSLEESVLAALVTPPDRVRLLSSATLTPFAASQTDATTTTAKASQPSASFLTVANP